MEETKPDTIGAFLCLINREGKVRYQMRTDERSITGISYRGDFELPGGKVEESDLHIALTRETLLKEAIRKTKEKLGITVSPDFIAAYGWLYRTVFVNPKDGKVDWAFAAAVPPDHWDETAEVKRKIVDVNPDELDVLGRLNLIVSGRKRMWRMGQAGLFFRSKEALAMRAAELLEEVMPDWRMEVLTDPREDLAEIRRNLGLEGKM